MRNSLNEKVYLIQNYADMIAQGERNSSLKDNTLIELAPKVNDPPFRQGIFQGGDHLLPGFELYS